MKRIQNAVDEQIEKYIEQKFICKIDEFNGSVFVLKYINQSRGFV